MTAREDLIYEMTHNHLYMDDDQANAKVDAFAHELAEQIRKAVKRGHSDWYESAREGGMREAADLIDPELKEQDND